MHTVHHHADIARQGGCEGGHRFGQAAHGAFVDPALGIALQVGNLPLVTDLQITREENFPELRVNVDRLKAGAIGVSEQDVAQTVLAGLVGAFVYLLVSIPISFLVAPIERLMVQRFIERTMQSIVLSEQAVERLRG